MIAPFADALVARLDEIPGIGPTAATLVISEFGVDMSRFPTSGHLGSWAKFAPGVKQSAGRRARAPPGTTTVTWPKSSARPPSPPVETDPSLCASLRSSTPGTSS